MTATDKTNTMGKKKALPSGEPPTRAVRMDRALVGKAEMIAKDKGMDVSAYISEAVRSVVDRDWAKLVKKVGGEGG